MILYVLYIIKLILSSLIASYLVFYFQYRALFPWIKKIKKTVDELYYFLMILFIAYVWCTGSRSSVTQSSFLLIMLLFSLIVMINYNVDLVIDHHRQRVQMYN